MPGARATGQILKIINREGKIGVRSQNPGTMYVSSIGSNCFPAHPTSPSASIPLVFRGTHPVSVAGGEVGTWHTYRMAVEPTLCPACGLAAPQPGGERSPEAPPTTFPLPYACPQRGSWLCGRYQLRSSSWKPSPCPHLGSRMALHPGPGQTCICSNPPPRTNTHAGLTNPVSSLEATMTPPPGV